MSEHQTSHELLGLIEALIEGTIDEAGFAVLDAMLAESEHARAIYRRYINVHAALPALVGSTPRLSVSITDPDEINSFADPIPTHRFLQLLADLEDNAPLVPHEPYTQGRPKPAPVTRKNDALTTHDLALVFRHVLRQALTSKTAIYAGITTAAAAVLLLALILINPFASNAPDPQQITELTQPTPTDWAQPTPRNPVATLTNTHNATWAEGASAPGSNPQTGDPLIANQRLTLTQGFAQITTTRGAIAIIQAPATIELINDNAIRLHTGKLVGICYAQSSKGFVVHTNHAKITDLGTEFGVEVQPDGQTYAAVFTGEVELSEQNPAAEQPLRSVSLTAGWSCQVSNQGELAQKALPLSAYDKARFVKSLEDAASPGLTYRRAVLASKPLVYWGFDEGQDATRNLAGNSDWDGKALGQTDRGAGLFGSALKLTGQLESMGGFASEMPLSFAQTQSYTLEAWCWLDQPHFGRVLALAELDEDLGVRPKHLSMIEVLGDDASANVNKPEHPSVRFLHRYPPASMSSQGENVFSDRAAPIGQWVHLVAVKDPQGVQIYMNGQRVAQNNTQQPAATDQPLGLFVGVSPIMLRTGLSEHQSDFRPFAGLIDEVAVYDTALTQETIKQHFLLGQAKTAQ